MVPQMPAALLVFAILQVALVIARFLEKVSSVTTLVRVELVKLLLVEPRRALLEGVDVATPARLHAL